MMQPKAEHLASGLFMVSLNLGSLSPCTATIEMGSLKSRLSGCLWHPSDVKVAFQTDCNVAGVVVGRSA